MPRYVKLGGMATGEERVPGHGGSANLPVYEVAGWPGQRQVSPLAGYVSTGGQSVLWAAEARHSHGSASLVVTSHRHQDGALTALRGHAAESAIRAAAREDADSGSPRLLAREAERLSSAAEHDQLIWENVTIPVDGQPVPFQAWDMTAGWWVAVGTVPGADLALESRGVPAAGLALVTSPLPEPAWRPFKRPGPPARRFPADAGPAAAVPDAARVDLTHERGRLITGSVGGQPVRLELSLPAHRGEAAGTIAGLPVSATWANGDNSDIHPDVPADLSGHFAGQPVELHATFHLEPGYFFHHGQITGRVGADDLQATVERAAGGLGGRTVAVDGRLGGAEFTIYATMDGPLRRGQLRGTVAGAPLRIDAERDGPPGPRRTRLTGSYLGPPALLALAAGAFLYFI
jgi:hypothetical protein